MRVKRGTRRVRALLFLTIFVGLAACTIQEAVKEPLIQRFVWFDYLNGEDIREACQPGTPWHYRLVYNARYKEQLRRYELLADGAGGGILVSRAQGGGPTGGFSLSEPLEEIQWKRSEVRLSAGEVAQFDAALRDSGFHQEPPVGLKLPSAGFYWVAISCRDGEVDFNAWRLPAEGDSGPTFPDFLFERDKTEVAVNPPREIDASQLTFKRSNVRNTKGQGASFLLTVGENGLAGF